MYLKKYVIFIKTTHKNLIKPLVYSFNILRQDKNVIILKLKKK